MYDSVALSTFAMLGNHHLYLVQAVLILRVRFPGQGSAMRFPRPVKARVRDQLLKLCSVQGPGWPSVRSRVRGGRRMMNAGTDNARTSKDVL